MTRVLPLSLRNSLLQEEEFAYAHLVKFEKPLKTVNGKSARRAKDYTYLTDGSFDIVFNDGSSDVEGNANNAQTYIANKIIKVGSTSETTEARASSISLTVSAAALSTSFIDSLTITSLSISTATKDFVEEGFREGDVIQLLSGSGANDTVKVRINSFSNANRTANITALTKVVGGVETSISALTAHSATSYSVNFASAEVESILNNRSSTGYARYINRDVFIYKVHIDKDTGAIIGNAYLLFKGIIASGKIAEDPNKQSIVTWSITSHWGDFQRVSGRITSDPYHRALDGNGIPDTDALIRPAYAADYGFLHSESAVNLMAIYQVNETRYKEKRRGGLAGLLGGKKLVEYEVEVDREVDLRFNLDAKYLPVVYGVNKIDSIPVFVDSLNTTAKKVYVAYALCEGEIGGIYDIYFDDTNSVCLDANDSSTRSSQTDNSTVDVLCTGRMDRGDTLRANSVTTGTTVYNGYPGGPGRGNWSSLDEAEIEAYYYQQAIGNPNVTFGAGSLTSGAGITHEKGYGFTTPIDTRLIFHAGKPDQEADALLVSQASNFKVGTDYYSGSTAYWGASHRLLDTAYAVAEFTISEGETTIPSLDFVVRGKGVECYNYDFSYEQDPDYASSDAASSAFNLGESVTLTPTSGGSSIGTATIADIYTLTNVDGSTSTRIRFLSEPPLNYNATTGLPAVTAFVMTSGSNSYHLVTHNHTGVTGTVAKRLEETVTSVANNSSTGVDLTLSNADSAMQQAIDFAELLGIYEGEASTADQRYAASLLNQYLFTANSSSKKVEAVGQTTTDSSSLVNKKVVLKDVVVLDSNASTTDNAYNGRFIEVTHIYSDNTVKVQKRKIIDYDGGTKVAKVETAFEEDAIPTANDTYKIFSVANDVRVSTNPAMQLLDYLTAKRYGRDLDLEDLDLPSFLEAGRDCDTRSDVTVVTTSVATVGDVYTLSHNNKVLWVGTVKSSTQIGSSSRYNTVFTDVSGKLAYRWENWKFFFEGEYYYYQGALHEASSDGVISATPSTTPSVSSFTIAKSSGSGSSSLTIETDKARSTEGGSGNPVVKIGADGTGPGSPGYSLYDGDDVKYWRYMGWESQNQRHVTRHQTNAVINTANPVFDNVNSMLGHFNGILRYSDGKYSLGVKKASATPSTVSVDGVSYTLGDISDDDIIGQINVEDAGQKGTFNQVSVTVNDPQNRFEGRSVNLFNSDYLKQDRMVPKKGSSKTPYITNYYNARLNAKQYLDESRAGLKVSFTIGPKGLLLRAGDIIRITYSRFGWANKLYRVKNLNFQENCLVQVTADEHNDDGYLIQPRQTNVVAAADPLPANMAPPNPPTGPVSPTLPATQNARGGIVLNWTNTSTFNPATYTVQVFRSATNNRSTAKVIGISKGDNFTDSITGTGKQTFYYWLRYSVNVPVQRTSGVAPREVFSNFFPSSATGGTVGVSDGAQDAPVVNLTNDNVSVAIGPDGNVVSFANTGTTITAFIGDSQLSYDDSSPYAEPSFRVSNVQASSGLTIDSSPSTGSNNFVLGNITAFSQDVGTVTYTIIVTDSLGRANTFERVQTFTKAQAGAKGEIGTKGEPGGPGDKGDKGGKGEVGAKGVRGDGGDKGEKGGKGDVGAKGVTGDGGDKGEKGPVGDQGAKGVTGDGGAKGAQGDKGAIGAKGVTGDGGAKGAAGDKGGVGAKGVTGDGGAKGATGDKGDTGAKGITGGQGDSGDKGAKGDTGPKGTTGVKGDPGEDVFIIYYAGLANDNLNGNATVDKNNPPLAPDMNGGSSSVSGAFRLTQANGTVTNWYTSSAGLNVFFIASAVAESITQAPRSEWTRSGFLQGDKGDKGALGDKGVKGDVGQKGDQGAKGDVGQKGNQGQKGGKGELGQKGAAGQKGNQGDKGVKGDLGQKGTAGQKGNQGDKGVKGDLGQKGTAGQKGDQGQKGGKGDLGQKGAAGQKGNQGDKGGKGDTGAKGAVGQKGNQGDKGTKGDLGQKGTTGQKGDTGQKGVTGQKGDTGIKGGPGDAGSKGATGVKGADGSPGADAPYVVIGFSSSVTNNTQRNTAIKNFSGLSVVKVNSVYWDAITGEIYQNRASETSNPNLTEISAVGTTAVVSDAISSNISATTTNQTTLSKSNPETLVLGTSINSRGGRIYTFYRGRNSPTTSGGQHSVRVRIRQAASTTTIGSTSFGGSIEATQTLSGAGSTHEFDIIDSFDSDISNGTNRIIVTGENTGTANNAASTRFLLGRQLIVFELKR